MFTPQVSFSSNNKTNYRNLCSGYQITSSIHQYRKTSTRTSFRYRQFSIITKIANFNFNFAANFIANFIANFTENCAKMLY